MSIVMALCIVFDDSLYVCAFGIWIVICLRARIGPKKSLNDYKEISKVLLLLLLLK